MLDVFFFKQKTAYVMRISDWSSDVCSSDLIDQLTLTGGIRYTIESSDYSGSTIDANPYGITTGIGLPLPVIFDNDFSDDNISGRVSAKFDITPSLSAYAAYGRGYKARSEEHTSELQSLMRNSYAVFCLK